MNKQNQKLLLQLARKTIENNFKRKDYNLKNIPAEFQEKRGVFVTLHEGGQLKGCIGNIEPLKSLYEGVKENVLNAAFHDPRFSKLREDELKKVPIINIDNSSRNENFATLNVVEPENLNLSQLVLYRIVSWRYKMDREAATALLTGIAYMKEDRTV